MFHSRCSISAAILALAATAAAQSNRSTTQTGFAFVGATFNAVHNYPTATVGNVSAFLWSPPFAGSTPLSASGFSFVGDLLVDPTAFDVLGVGITDGTGAASMPIAVPNAPSLVGIALDCQSFDVDTTQTFYMAANDIAVQVGIGIPGNIAVTSATTTSLTVGNNNLQRIANDTIGAPQSYGQPLFSFLPVRHRGDEGFVEGYAGTFSSTSHLSDINSVSFLRNGRRLANGAYQALSLANGHEISIIRDLVNPKQYSILSFNRATGLATVIPGSTWVDTGTTTAPAQQNFYLGLSRDGQWGAIYLRDSNTTTGFLPKVWAFRTDATQPVIDVTPAGITALNLSFFDGSLVFSNDFLIAFGAGGTFWTSATAPSQMQPLNLGTTTFSNLPNVWAYPLAWRVSPDNSKIYMGIGSNPTNARAEMDLVQIANNAGTPQVTNWTQFPAATGLAEFGYSSYTPASTNSSSIGIKCSVSPDGNKVALLAATTTTTAFPGLYVADGTPNPTLYSVPGAVFYSDVAFINNTTVMFLAGAVPTVGVGSALYKLDLTSGNQAGAITQVSAANDIRSRGSWFSNNKNFWYFIRSNFPSSVNNLIGVNCATGATFNVTGDEASFGPASAAGNILSGSFNATSDPWFALEMQLRRSPVGGMAYFTARRANAGGIEDANVFGFDMESGGQATALTSNTAIGTGAGSVINIENLTISADGNHLAYTQRVGTAATATTPENVWHFNLTTNVATQLSTSNPLGQTITDGSVRFVGGTNPQGVVWSLGTGSATTVAIANGIAQYAPLGVAGAALTISPAPAGSRFWQILGAY